MEKIFLVNMPITALNSPSIALTQLKSVLDGKFRDRVSVEILYLNHDFARYMGVGITGEETSREPYRSVLSSLEATHSGLGDWFFRQSAFPGVSDNTEMYFQRYYPRHAEQIQTLKQYILEKRQGLNQFLENLIDKYQIDQAGVVGFTSMFSQNMACFALARKLRERHPDTVIVMGGANCETPMGQEIARHIEHIDFVFSGPSLKSFPELVQYYLDRKMEKCRRIKGVFSKMNSGDGNFGINDSVGEELDIDEVIELDYETFLDSLREKFPHQNIKPRLFFETSRGCWWGERAHCTFCGLNGMTMKYRPMNPDKAIEQFKYLFARYSSRCSLFQSVDNIMPRSYLQEVFPYLDTPTSTKIFYEVKADLTNEELQVLSKAGVKDIQPGIESLATSTLKLMKKGTTAFNNLILLKNCVKHSIHPIWNLLVGFPGEGEEVYKKYLRDIPLLVHLYPPSGVYPVRFDRYSPYFIQAEKYGLDLHPYDFYELIYPFSKEVVANIAYYFMDHNINAEYFVVMVKWIDKIREKIDLWCARWKDENQTLLPKLFFKRKGTSTIVYDSRSVEVIEHQVSDVTRQMLEHLNYPRRITELAAELSHIPGFDPEKEVAFLQDRGLVFQEGERFLSLVLPEEPPPASELTERSDMVEKGKDRGTQTQEPALVPISREAHRARLSSVVRRFPK